MVSDFTQQLTFKKLPLVKFWCDIEVYPQLFEKNVKIFLTTYLCEARFFFIHFKQNNVSQHIEGKSRQEKLTVSINSEFKVL